MGLAILVLGLVLFIGAHVFVTMRAQRKALIRKIGPGPYQGLFALIAIAGIVLMSWGYGTYRATDWIPVWDPPSWTRHVTVFLMWPATIAFVATYIPGDIKRVLKNPTLIAVKLWAVAHLISNGDLGSIILFGSLLAWAVYDRITLKYRTDPGGPNIPVGGRRNDIIAIVVGTIVYLLLGFLFHPLVIGVPVFGTPALGI
jgi:uncharacterized membrane protein